MMLAVETMAKVNRKRNANVMQGFNQDYPAFKIRVIRNVKVLARKRKADEMLGFDEDYPVAKFPRLMLETEVELSNIQPGVVLATSTRRIKNKSHKEKSSSSKKSSSSHMRKSEKKERVLIVEPRCSNENKGLHEYEEQDEEILNRFESSPWFIDGQMRDHQLEGLNWLIDHLNSGTNGILADDMGLGKTIQTIALLGYVKHCRKIKGHHLVIAPKTVIYNWITEFNTFCPTLKAIRFHGNPKERSELLCQLLNRNKSSKPWDVCVTTYETFLAEINNLNKIQWNYVIIDEAHRIKNEKTLAAQAVRQISSRNRLLLTGSPINNNYHELWALLNFVEPNVFDDPTDFDLSKGSDSYKIAIQKQMDQIVKPFIMRRLKIDVLTELPSKIVRKIVATESELQRNLTNKFMLGNQDKLFGGVPVPFSEVLRIIMQLRKYANHPYLFDGFRPDEASKEEQLDQLINCCGKMKELDKLLERSKKEGRRVLIFSSMKRVLDLIAEYCSYKGYTFSRLDGETEQSERTRLINEFNSSTNQDPFLFLMTTKAGGVGVNLTSADSVILYDSDWNPQNDQQAMDRAHRIGQKKRVRVYRLVTEETIDEWMVKKAEGKLELVGLLDGDTSSTKSSNQGVGAAALNELRRGFRRVQRDAAQTDDQQPIASTSKHQQIELIEIDD